MLTRSAWLLGLPSLPSSSCQACVVGRALDHALDIFEFLVAGRAAHELVPASIQTYNHLIHACHQVGRGGAGWREV